MLKKKVDKKTFKFSIGQIVRVKSKQEILKNFNSSYKFYGYLFMNQMWEYCGKEIKIIKNVKNFFDEYRYKMYKTRSLLYILDKVICSGIIEGLDQRCDRSCYLLWHEEWLERISNDLID